MRDHQPNVVLYIVYCFFSVVPVCGVKQQRAVNFAVLHMQNMPTTRWHVHCAFACVASTALHLSCTGLCGLVMGKGVVCSGVPTACPGGHDDLRVQHTPYDVTSSLSPPTPAPSRLTDTTSCARKRWRASSTCTASPRTPSTATGAGRSCRVSTSTPRSAQSSSRELDFRSII